MENSFQTSFIPKKPIVSDSIDREPRSLFLWVSTFLLIISIASSVLLFVYKIYLTKQKESASSSLLATRNSFEQETIDELELFDKRTSAAKQILTNHVVLSPVFSLLGEITIPSVQYTSFTQQTNKDGFLVAIEGVARDYRSIALQADMFNSIRGRSFSNVLFSNLTKDKNNNINFDLKFNISPELLSYEKNVLLEQNTFDNTVINPLNSTDTTTNTTPTTPTSSTSTTQANTTTNTPTPVSPTTTTPTTPTTSPVAPLPVSSGNTQQ